MSTIRPSFMTKEQLDKYMSDLRQSRQPKSQPNYNTAKNRFSLEFSENDVPTEKRPALADTPKAYSSASIGVRGSLRNREPRKSKNGWIVNSGWQIPRSNTEPKLTTSTENKPSVEQVERSDSTGNMNDVTLDSLSLSNLRDAQTEIKPFHHQHQSSITPPPEVAEFVRNGTFARQVQPSPYAEDDEDEDEDDNLPEEVIPAPLRVTKSPSPDKTPWQPSVHSSQRPEPVPQVIPNNRVGYSSNSPPTPASTPPTLEQRPRWEDRGVPTYASVQPPTPPTKVIMMEDDEIVGEMVLNNPEADLGYNVQRTRNPNAPAPSQEVSKIAKAIASRQDTASGRRDVSSLPAMSFDAFTSQRPSPPRAQTTALAEPERPAAPVTTQSWSGNSSVQQSLKPKALPRLPRPEVPVWARQPTLFVPGQNINVRSHRASDKPLPINPTITAKALPSPPRNGGYKGPIPVLAFDDDEPAPPPPRRSVTPQSAPRSVTPQPMSQDYNQRPLPPVQDYTSRPLPQVQNYDQRPLPSAQQFNAPPAHSKTAQDYSRPLPSTQHFNAPPAAHQYGGYTGNMQQPVQSRPLPQYNSFQAPNVNYGQPPQKAPPQRQQTFPAYNAHQHNHQQQSRPLPPATPLTNARPLPPPQNYSVPPPQNYTAPQPQHNHSRGSYQQQPTPSHNQQFNTHTTNSANRIPVPRSTACCTACANPITSRAVSAQGQRFHPECFTCAHCFIKLEHVAFFPEPTPDDHTPPSGRFYCHCDFHELFSPRCKSCKTPIEGEVVVALGASYHAGHFFCAECGDPFDSKSRFVEKDNFAWCVGCYQHRYSSKCKGCKKPVTDTVVKALGADWHVECFCCVQCGSQFDDGRYFLRDGKQFEPVCVRCEETRLKGW